MRVFMPLPRFRRSIHQSTSRNASTFSLKHYYRAFTTHIPPTDFVSFVTVAYQPARLQKENPERRRTRNKSRLRFAGYLAEIQIAQPSCRDSHDRDEWSEERIKNNSILVVRSIPSRNTHDECEKKL